VALAALTAALLLPGVVHADTELGEQGRVGPHLLIDTESSPGARCDYSVIGDGLRFVQMEVQPPVAYPVAGRARQKVAWAVRLQMKRPGFGWKTKLQTAWYVKRATASTPAPFESTWVSWKTAGSVRWRALVVIEWRHQGLPVGSTRHRVDHYAIGASMDVAVGACENLLGDPARRRPSMEAS
jgi:hypothetical protein